MPWLTRRNTKVHPDDDVIIACDEAHGHQLVRVEEVLTGHRVMAFDHERIMRHVIDRVADQPGVTDLATAFLGPRFTLPEVQSV